MEAMAMLDLLVGIGVGVIGGFTSGLLGVSPGGALVVFGVLLLGVEQHVAQGISLIAQIPPTSIAGIRRYWKRGIRGPIGWLVWMTIGFLAGGIGGALAAGAVSAVVLRWAYVVYLIALDVLMIARRADETTMDGSDIPARPIHWLALLIVGVAAGFSSGFMGIGGGLAITVGLSACLKVPRHQSQLISLVLSIIPTTIPAAWIYWREGWSTSWLVIAGVIIGLWGGTDFGARMANRVSANALRRMVIGLVSAMALYMGYKALT
jgi:uncharacterized protein